MATSKPVVGILGGGQLGLMLAQAAAPLDIPIAILDAESAPAKRINVHPANTTGSYKDASKVKELAPKCDFVTVETEHVNAEVLEELSGQGAQVHPSWKTLKTIQDKYAQKSYFAKAGVPVAEQMDIASGDAMLASIKEASSKFGFPWMLKSKRDAFDGRGNLKISGEADLQRAVEEFGALSCYAEKWVPFELELSVVVVRTEDSQGKTKRLLPYPVVETVHDDNICSRVYMPPRKASDDVCKRAQQVACDVVDKLWGRGVYAVEMFVTKDGSLAVNEVAPRVHNSGHLTIEAIPYMSQFKAHLLAILDKPLPEELQPHVSSSIMINILGGAQPDSYLRLVRKAESMYGRDVAVYTHLYGKESKPSRKIGHITVTGFGSIAELEAFVQPLVDLAEEIRQERHQASSAALRPQQTLSQPSKTKEPAIVLVTMGSDSDLPVLKAGIDILNQFGVPWEVNITSAHRTPKKMGQVASDAAARGIKVIIAAAGGAAHLPGMVAAYTPLPVIGVPVKASTLDGMDSLLSIVQMPRGVPVAAVAINNSTNAALLAIRIIGAFQPKYLEKMKEYQDDMERQVNDKADTLQEIDVEAYLTKMSQKK